MDILVLKIDGVEGESHLDGYDKQIVCHSFSHGVSNALQADVSNIGRSRGRVEHTDFSVTKYYDKSSPLLAYKCCIGANLGTITFTVLRTGGDTPNKPMMIYTLENAMVSNCAVSGGGGDTPIETVSFAYSKIRWEYKVQDETVAEPGSVAAEWDLTVNVGAPK